MHIKLSAASRVHDIDGTEIREVCSRTQVKPLHTHTQKGRGENVWYS